MERFSISTQRWIYVGWIFCVVMISVLSTSYCVRNLKPQEVEDIIASNERLKRVEKLCNSVPKPKSWKFIRKSLGGNSNTATISYHFQTDLDSNEFEKLDLKWFEKNGWKPEYEGFLDFTKDNQKLGIEGNNKSIRVKIYCSEKY